MSSLADFGFFDSGWIYALEKPLEEEKETPRSGKWMLWPEESEVVQVWSSIYQATVGRTLGTQAKISARLERGKSNRVICVYTNDSDDMAELCRVAGKLRDIVGEGYLLLYKEDEATRIGMYSERNAKLAPGRRVAKTPTSKWRVAPFTREVRPVKGYVLPAKRVDDIDPLTGELYLE